MTSTHLSRDRVRSFKRYLVHVTHQRCFQRLKKDTGVHEQEAILGATNPCRWIMHG